MSPKNGSDLQKNQPHFLSRG